MIIIHVVTIRQPIQLLSPLVQLGGISPTSTLLQHKAAEVTDTSATTTSQTADRSAFDGSSPDQLNMASQPVSERRPFWDLLLVCCHVRPLWLPVLPEFRIPGDNLPDHRTVRCRHRVFTFATGIILQYFGERFGRRSAALAKLRQFDRSALILESVWFIWPD